MFFVLLMLIEFTFCNRAHASPAMADALNFSLLMVISYKQTWHVGKLRSRCMVELTCSAEEKKLNASFNPGAENKREMAKSVPQRYPSNSDSLGIELVGAAVANDPKKPDDLTYETVADAQNKSLQWLVAELEMTLGIATTEVFRHPTVSRKNASEASTAKW